MDLLKTLGWISYGLHLVVAVATPVVVLGNLVAVLPCVGLLLLAVLIDWIKRSDARGTWQESHYNGRIFNAKMACGLYVMSMPFLPVFLVGWLGWCFVSIWLIFRVARGMIFMANDCALSS